MDGIVVDQLGRLGNNIFQLWNAIELASAKGFSCVHLEKIPVLPDSFTCCGIRIYNGAMKSKNREGSLEAHSVQDHLRGDFFFRSQHSELDGLNPLPSVVDCIRENLEGDFSDSGWEEGQLTVHLRGGDIFRFRPHPDYGQPPVGFYRKVIESRPWRNILVVSEDPRPFLALPLRLIAAKYRIPIRFESTNVLRDFHTLLGAENLCVGVSHLAWAATELSPRLLRVYSFEYPQRVSTTRQSVEKFVVSDTRKSYVRTVMQSNWKGSPVQLARMLFYGAKNLSAPLPIEDSGR